LFYKLTNITIIFKLLEAVILTSRELLIAALKILDGKKAEDVTAIDIEGISVIADYFLLASGNSTTQVKALAEEIEFKLSEQGVKPLRIEGAQSASWIILDYGDLIIHVFHHETRAFYNLERLWADGKTLDAKQLIEA
jgi:ribosome-associated protein